MPPGVGVEATSRVSQDDIVTALDSRAAAACKASGTLSELGSLLPPEAGELISRYAEPATEATLATFSGPNALAGNASQYLLRHTGLVALNPNAAVGNRPREALALLAPLPTSESDFRQTLDCLAKVGELWNKHGQSKGAGIISEMLKTVAGMRTQALRNMPRSHAQVLLCNARMRLAGVAEVLATSGASTSMHGAAPPQPQGESRLIDWRGEALTPRTLNGECFVLRGEVEVGNVG